MFLTQCVPDRWRGAAGLGLSCPSGSHQLHSVAGTHKQSESPDSDRDSCSIRLFVWDVLSLSFYEDVKFKATKVTFRDTVFLGF